MTTKSELAELAKEGAILTAKKHAAIRNVMEILKGYGLTVMIGGCGCCGSPWVKIAHCGEIIIDDEYAGFDMFEENQNEN